MSLSCRLALIASVLIGSAAYAVLVAQNPSIASAIAVGYVALLVTVITVIQIWRRP
jgi:membrane protein YdbS with pleckstrin-like domain